MNSGIKILGTVLLLLNCSSFTGTPELPPNEDLIIGSWVVHIASIDGQNYPITNPGFGQIKVSFDESNLEYIYPLLNEYSLPTTFSDTLNAAWNFDDSYTSILITNRDDGGEDLNWEILEIGVGLLHTRYEGQSPTDPNILSTYDITYSLIN